LRGPEAIDGQAAQLEELVEVEQIMGVRAERVRRATSSPEMAHEATDFSDGLVAVVEEIKRNALVMLASLNAHGPPRGRTLVLAAYTTLVRETSI